MKKSMIACMAAVFLLQACATIVHTSDQNVQINTVPPGISARIGTQDCVTPCTLNVPRASDRVYLRKGKTEKEYYLDKGYNLGATICGNILWLVPGLIVDFIAGGAYTIKPINVRFSDLE
jgi:hypothetical protein